MELKKSIKKENIKLCNKYYTCNYSGEVAVTVIKIFNEEDKVLVKANSNKCKPFVRDIKYIFDNPQKAKNARHDWEHDQRKWRKK